MFFVRRVDFLFIAVTGEWGKKNKDVIFICESFLGRVILVFLTVEEILCYWLIYYSSFSLLTTRCPWVLIVYCGPGKGIGSFLIYGVVVVDVVVKSLVASGYGGPGRFICCCEEDFAGAGAEQCLPFHIWFVANLRLFLI